MMQACQQTDSTSIICINYCLNTNTLRNSATRGTPNARLYLSGQTDLSHVKQWLAAGVTLEDRQDLSGQRAARSLRTCSAAELTRLIEAANRVYDRVEKKPDLVVLRRLGASQLPQNPRKYTPCKNEDCKSLIWWVVKDSNLRPSD